MQTKPITNSEKSNIVNERVEKSSENRELISATKKIEKPIKTETKKEPEKPIVKPVEKSEPQKLVNNNNNVEKAKSDCATPKKVDQINENKKCDKQSGEKTKTSEIVKDNNIRKTNLDKTEPLVKQESENTSKELKKNPEKTSENESKLKEKVLLNPYSGKLESVPLTVPEKSTDPPLLKKEKPDEPVTNSIPLKNENPDDKTKPDDARKSNVNLLKSFRREKPTPNRDGKVQLKNGTGDSLTITTISKREKHLEKQEANVSIEIKSENKNCEYDFDSNSPPNKIMSLKEYTKSEQFKTKFGKNVNNWLSFPEFRKQAVKENGGSNEDSSKKDKLKTVPSLYRIGTDQNKKIVQKTPNGKVEKPEEKRTSPTVINIKTENQNNKPEIKIEVADSKNEATPKPVKLEKREDCAKKIETQEVKKDEKKVGDAKNDNGKSKVDNLSPEQTDLLRGLLKRMSNAEKEHDNAKKAKVEDSGKSEAIDLTKPENNQQKPKNPESPAEAKPSETKSHDNMVEMLIAAAQKQSIEALLKIPQFSQNLKSAPMQLSPTQGKSFPPGEISQALQYFQNLKNQCDPNFHHSQNLIPFPFFQQNIEIVNSHKRLKKSPDTPPQRKIPKLSPNSEVPKIDKQKLPSPTSESKPKSQSPPKTSPSKEDIMALKTKMERTLSKIQAETDLQNRMIANYKNMPQILQYMNRHPAMMYHPGAISPSKVNQSKPKPSHSPNSQKSPQNSLIPSSSNLTPGSGFLTPDEYNRAVNSNLHPQMTFIEMFRDYIKQQERLNHSVKTNEKEQKVTQKQSPPNTNLLSNPLYGSHDGKKTAEHSPISNPQKT